MQQAKSVRREKTDKHADNQTKETKPQMIMHEILCLDIGKPLCKERQTKQTDRNGGSGGGGGFAMFIIITARLSRCSGQRGT